MKIKKECETSIKCVVKNRYIIEIPEIRTAILQTNDAFDIFDNENITDIVNKIDSDDLNAFCLVWNHIHRCQYPDCRMAESYFRLIPPGDWGKTSVVVLRQDIYS